MVTSFLCFLGLVGLAVTSPVLNEDDQGLGGGPPEMTYVEPQNADELRGNHH